MRVFLLFAAALCALCGAPAVAVGQGAKTDAGPVEVAKYLDFQPGQESAALAALRKYRAATRAQQGADALWVLQEIGRPSRFAVVERWRDGADYRAHLASPASAHLSGDTAAIRRAPADERAHSDFLSQSGGAPTPSSIVVLTHVDVTPPHRPITEGLLQTFVAGSRKEPGVLDFDAFRQQGQPNHFTLLEVWTNRAAFLRHGAAPAARAFRRAIAPLLGALYDERVYKEVD